MKVPNEYRNLLGKIADGRQQPIDYWGLAEELGIDFDKTQNLINYLEALGLISVTPTLGGGECIVTDEGKKALGK